MNSERRRMLVLSTLLGAAGAVGGTLYGMSGPELRAATMTAVIGANWGMSYGPPGTAGPPGTTEDLGNSLVRRIDKTIVPELQTWLRAQNRPPLPAVTMQVDGARLDSAVTITAAAPVAESEQLLAGMGELRALVQARVEALDRLSRTDAEARVQAANARINQLQGDIEHLQMNVQGVGELSGPRLTELAEQRRQLAARTASDAKANERLIAEQLRLLATVNSALASRLGGAEPSEPGVVMHADDAVTQSAYDNVCRLRTEIQAAARAATALDSTLATQELEMRKALSEAKQEAAVQNGALSALLQAEIANLRREDARLSVLVPPRVSEPKLEPVRRARPTALAGLGALVGVLLGVVIARAPLALRAGSEGA